MKLNRLPPRIRRAAWELLIAVQHFRSDAVSLPAHLWIDSICIIQGHLRERGLQVQLMRELYSTANLPVVAVPYRYGGEHQHQAQTWLCKEFLTSHNGTCKRKTLRGQSEHLLGLYQYAHTSIVYGTNATSFGHAYWGDPNVLKTALDAKFGDSILFLFRRIY